MSGDTNKKNTKKIKYIIYPLIIFVALFIALLITGKHRQYTYNFFALDTVANIKIQGVSKREAARLSQDLEKISLGYDDMLSRTKSDSYVSKFNQSESSLAIPDDMVWIMEKAIFYGEITGGAFDVTVAPVSKQWDFKSPDPVPPPDADIKKALQHVDYTGLSIDKDTLYKDDPDIEIDLGGIAKGFVADECKKYLVENGVTSAIIDFGGNILTIGDNNGEPWKIAIYKPSSDGGEEIAGVLDIKDKSVVTSGIGERSYVYEGKVYHHILDPKTGYPVENDLYSVTIISDVSVDGDALSTSAFVLGAKEGMELIESIDGVEAIFIKKDGEIITSSGFEDDYIFTPANELG